MRGQSPLLVLVFVTLDYFPTWPPNPWKGVPFAYCNYDLGEAIPTNSPRHEDRHGIPATGGCDSSAEHESSKKLTADYMYSFQNLHFQGDSSDRNEETAGTSGEEENAKYSDAAEKDIGEEGDEEEVNMAKASGNKAR